MTSVGAIARDEATLRALATEAETRFGGLDPVASARAAIEWAHQTFGPELVVASSMGDEALVHLAAAAAPGIDVLFLDTGYHFAETIGTRDAVAATYDVNVRTVLPLLTVAEQDARHGKDLYATAPDKCCEMRKVEPLNRGLEPYTAWITGMRREDAPTRTDIPVVGWDDRRAKLKLNPMAAWTQADVDAYVEEHGVMLNPLRAAGYASIGCAPCTQPVAEGADPRSGRWSGFNKTECGLHT